MIKRLAIILTIFHLNIAFAMDGIPSMPNPVQMMNDSVADIVDPPNTAALNIMVSALSSLKELRKADKATPENIKSLIKIKLIPSIAMDVSTELALKKHWKNLNDQQKHIFQQYISQSLMKDYAGILGSYEKLDSVSISVDPKVKRKDNKAIVELFITLNDDPKPIKISLKMIRSNQWKVYDVVFSGVSLVKNYAAQFNSHIRRKGIDSLIAKTVKKLK
ncbi:MAG: ABC transporter substrate-binding protein [Candidatus Ruthia sp.]|nr:ABC transporter substrate-binding protein [Candidatus Ruthturnera sp.]MBT4122480.1 ABC transporter substrate-binding protein [Candidatus Ruthturnera sp.]